MCFELKASYSCFNVRSHCNVALRSFKGQFNWFHKEFCVPHANLADVQVGFVSSVCRPAWFEGDFSVSSAHHCHTIHNGAFFACKILPKFKPITRWGSREPPYILNQNMSPIYSALRNYSYTPNFLKCCCLMLNCFKLLFSTSIYTLMVKQK